MNSDEFILPTTESDLDLFVADITKMFDLPEGDDTYDMIATMILHLPTAKAYATKEYFGHGVLKSMANRVAFKKLKELKEKREAAQADADKPIKGGSDVESLSDQTI